MNEPILLSIVIPAYNEASRKGLGIKEHLQSIKAYFQGKNISYEVVIVNDGSKDNTSQLIGGYCSVDPNLVFIDRKENKGKLFSVQEGLLKARENLGSLLMLMARLQSKILINFGNTLIKMRILSLDLEIYSNQRLKNISQKSKRCLATLGICLYNLHWIFAESRIPNVDSRFCPKKLWKK